LERACGQGFLGASRIRLFSRLGLYNQKFQAMALKWVSSVKDKNYLAFFMEKQISKTFKKMAVVC